jgi:hypothetical protein
MRALLTSTALLIGFLALGVSPAQAAKGVKKKPASNGVQVVHGVVTQVHHDKAKSSAGHLGEITIKTTHHKKKGKSASSGGKSASHTHKFSVGSGTKFEQIHGKQVTPAHFAAIHAGEHVAITAKGNHAELVAIQHHAKK